VKKREARDRCCRIKDKPAFASVSVALKPSNQTKFTLENLIKFELGKKYSTLACAVLAWSRDIW
jgi:hypothetical protein